MSITGLGGPTLGTKYSHAPQSKDLPVCQEIITSVEQFKHFLTEQKKTREELINLSQQPLFRLKDDVTSMVQQVSAVISGLRRIVAQHDILKGEVLKEEKHIGIAQRNSEIGVSLQMENNATTEYFLNKLLEFDTRVRSYKQELDVLEAGISSQTRPCLSPKELVALLRQMDNEFICLAAQLHTTYEQVKVLKARYVRNIRALSGDTRSPFAEVEASSLKLRQLDGIMDNGVPGLRKPTSKTPYGPSPFTSLSISPMFPLAALGTQPNPSAVMPQATSLSFLTPSSTISSSVGLGFGLGTSVTKSLTNPLIASVPGAPSQTTSTGSIFSFNAANSGTTTQPKPLFGFGTLTTSASSTTPALSVSGQTTGQQLPSLGFGGFGAATSTGDGLFGKRLASKPGSLALPKT
ncbi:Nucleoporin p58/p45 [Clonorchis sinensis]|uniref:Nucleoporin p58/p45 n=1 Tax=Clonorchis sinensis TaxID=79923 RepID=A0A8T1M3R6_CLOSI|nr:Nucleoporin p58/p45 [Clonorchis sinensis]